MYIFKKQHQVQHCGLWTTMKLSWHDKMYQALDADNTCYHTFFVGLGVHMGFVDNKNNIEYRHTCF